VLAWGGLYFRATTIAHVRDRQLANNQIFLKNQIHKSA
jgi:hypothetical protein